MIERRNFSDDGKKKSESDEGLLDGESESDGESDDISIPKKVARAVRRLER